MGKVYIGVVAVGGHKLWGGVGGNWVAELGVLGEHGRCDGGRREVAALPEGLIARRGDDDSYAAAHAQPLDGPFVDGLRRISAQRHIVLMGTVHVAPEQVTERDADSRVPTRSL